MATTIIVQEGTGTVVFWKYPGKPKFLRLQMQLTQAAFNGQNTPSIPTSHLNSLRPRPGEIGGQTFQPGVLGDPGMLVLDGFFDPSVVLPEGSINLQIRYLRQRGFKHPARWEADGFFMDRSTTIPLSAAMTSNRSIKLSGVLRLVPAQRTT